MFSCLLLPIMHVLMVSLSLLLVFVSNIYRTNPVSDNLFPLVWVLGGWLIVAAVYFILEHKQARSVGLRSNWMILVRILVILIASCLMWYPFLIIVWSQRNPYL